MMDENPLLPLLKVVFFSILEVFLLCLAGYVLAWRGVLDRKTQKQLNKLNVSLFTPSLLFSKVAFSLSPEKLKELWIIPLFFVLVTLVSMTISFALGLVFNLKPSQRSFAMAAAMFMNSNSLPIALMQSLVLTVPSLKWSDQDDRDSMLARALTYLVLYSTLGLVLRWSYGVRLLAQADPEPVNPPTIYHDEPEPLIDADETAFPPPPHERGDPLVDIEEEPSRAATLFNIDHHTDFHSHPHHESLHPPPPFIPRRPQQHRTHSSFFRSFPNSPEASPSITRPASPSISSDISNDESGFHHVRTHVLPGRLSAMRKRVASAWKTFNEFMTVPLWAALASIIVACVYPIQHALVVHITPVKGALERAGDCSIPITLVVLGGYFYTPPPENSHDKLPNSLSHRASASVVSLVSTVKEFLHLRPRNADESGHGHDSSSTLAWGGDSELGRRRTGDEALLTATRAKGRPGETKTVFIAVLSRMILTPLALLPLMTLAAKYDWHSVFEDPVFVVSNVLLVSSPPALTLAQITQAASGEQFERLISRTIFWAYCVVTPPATILYVVIGLLLTKI